MAPIERPCSDTRQADERPLVRREGRRTVIVLRGEHDLSTAPALASALTHVSTDGTANLVVDLSGVEFMDAAIVAVLFRARDQLRQRARELDLRDPSPFARRILAVCEGATGPHRTDTAPRVVSIEVAPTVTR
jgi:anti-sigma B factor antagonist